MKNIKIKIIIITKILILFLFFGTSLVKAETICSYKGPDTSSDLLRLTNFSVIGNSFLKVGDSIVVKFNLQNYNQTNLNLGSKGIFVAARDSDNSDRSFGFIRANTNLKIGEMVSIEVTKVLDKSGGWTIWPSYEILVGKEYKLGPDNWQSCVFNVSEPIIDSDKDGIPDQKDNCPQNYNPKQEDIDNDDFGNACDSCDDRDNDNDKIKNCLDNCPNEPENYNQYQDNDGCPDEIIRQISPEITERAPLPSVCGNGRCEEGENSTNCCRDCSCPAGEICNKNICQKIAAATPPLTAPPLKTEETYIIGFISSIRVNDDKDPLGFGEMMIAAFSKTGEKIQKIGWPAQMWLPVSNDNVINQQIPLFAFKESEMDDNLIISVTAADNDSWPGWLSWLEGLVGLISDLIDRALSFVLSFLNSAFTSIRELELRVETVRVHILHDFLVGNEEIGAVNKVFTRAENWGAKDVFAEPHILTGGDLRLSIWIGRISVPTNKNYKYTVKVKNVSFSDTGDYADGEVWINFRTASNFDENGNMAATLRRVPNSGTWSANDGSLLEGVRMFAPDGREMERAALFFSTDLQGPFIFLEANAWDYDNPDIGDDHDLIGEYSTMILFSDFDLPPVTTETHYAGRTDYPWVFGENTITMPFLTRQNMRLNFEITRYIESR